MRAEPIDLVVRGGQVVNPDWRGDATILVASGRVVALVDPDEPLHDLPSDARVVDARGGWVLPGGVDPHAHPGIEFGGYATQDGYEECSIAALHGGTTCFIDFAIPFGGETPVEAVAARRGLAGESLVDTAVHGAVTRWTDDTPAQLDKLYRDGVPTIKLFTTYRDLVMADHDTVRRVLQTLARLGGMAYVHAESNHLIEGEQERLAAEGRLDARYLPESRPPLSECDAVEAVLNVAEHTGAAVYFVHQSTPEAVDRVLAARARGVAAYSETCPHYLLLEGEAYARPGGEGLVCCPPVRARSLADALLDRVMTGAVDAIGSDHCCFTLAQKRQGRSDFRAMPFGLPGIETRMPLLLSELVHRRGLAPERFVQLTAANPARLNGLYPRKGVLAPGSDADMAVWDPSAERVLSAAALHMPTDYSPYEGMRVTGWPSVTIAGGEVLVQDGELTGRRTGAALAASGDLLAGPL